MSVFSIATSFTNDAQGIADNTVTTIVAYLLALAALLLAMKVFLGFEATGRTAGQALGDRADDGANAGADRSRIRDVPVESEGQNPAA